jgi:hypothetical protein
MPNHDRTDARAPKAKSPESLAALKRAREEARFGKPNTRLNELFEEARTIEEVGTLLQGDGDFFFLQSRVLERIQLLGAVVHYIPVSTERDPRDGIGPKQSAGVDPLDGDILDPGFFDNPELEDQRKFNMRCLMEHEPSKQNLKRYGVDEERDITFHIPVVTLETEGLVSKWRVNGADIGDLVFWDKTWYIIQNVHRGSYFGQRDLPFLIACMANRYRHNSVPTEDVAVNDVCPEEDF